MQHLSQSWVNCWRPNYANSMPHLQICSKNSVYWPRCDSRFISSILNRFLEVCTHNFINFFNVFNSSLNDRWPRHSKPLMTFVDCFQNKSIAWILHMDHSLLFEFLGSYDYVVYLRSWFSQFKTKVYTNAVLIQRHHFSCHLATGTHCDTNM